jgi:hypothetical protein
MGAQIEKCSGTLRGKGLRIVAAARKTGRGHVDFAKLES